MRGQVDSVDSADTSICLSGPGASPRSLDEQEWYTWDALSRDSPPTLTPGERSIRWRYIDESARKQPKPIVRAPRLASCRAKRPEPETVPEPTQAMLGRITAVEIAACLLRLRATCTDPGARAWAQRLAMTIDP